MIVVHGIARFGVIDEVDGEYLVTQFHHVFRLPLVPIGSEWVTGRDRAGVHGRACRLSWRSVFVAYLRTWGLAAMIVLLAVAASGATALLVPGSTCGTLALCSFWVRRQRDPDQLRRIALQRPAIGIALDPAQLPRDSVDLLLPLVQERFEAVSGGHTAVELAAHGTRSPLQAAYAFVLLRLLSVTTHGIAASNAWAASMDLLRRQDPPAVANEPYRTAPARTITGSPLLTGYLLAPHRWYGVTATLASWAAFIIFVLPGPLDRTCVCSLGRPDIARAIVMKLAYESYPQWQQSHGGCPTIEELAEYGGSVKDPWGEDYVILCNRVWTDADGVAVFSRGPDRHMGTADDINSWSLAAPDRVSLTP